MLNVLLDQISVKVKVMGFYELSKDSYGALLNLLTNRTLTLDASTSSLD